jgi:hypothetical protein
LPTRIIAREFEILRDELKNLNDIDLKFTHTVKSEMELDLNYVLDIDNILEYCYELNENETPARYRLKHLDRIFEGYNDRVKYIIFYSSKTR